MKKFVSISMALLMMLSIAGCSKSEESASSASSGSSASSSQAEAEASTSDGEILIKLAHSSPDTVPMHHGAVKFSELCNELSDGKINVEVYAN